MKLRQFIFASILLLTYIVEFAHDLVPHSHEVFPIASMIDLSYENQHQHQHLNHKTENFQVSHFKHVDKSILEYVICLFESSGHKCANHEPQQSNSFNTDLHQDVQFALVPSVVKVEQEFAGFSSELIVEHSTEVVLNYNPAFPSNANVHRGPPSISC